MTAFKVYLYCEKNGKAPLLDWLKGLPKRIYAKAIVRIERLQEMGHQLRRPEADYLRDGIYELRWRFQSVQYRLLYFFYGRDTVILTHGLTKEDRVPDKDIDLALQYKRTFEAEPAKHIFEMNI